MHYMVSCPEIPGELLRDNPSGLRVIFALRDPISRMWSDYRFAANWYRNKGLGFNDVVDGSLPEYGACFDKYVNGTVADEFERGIRSMPRKRRNGPNLDAFPFFNGEKLNLEEPTIRLSQRQSLDEGSVVFYRTRCNTAAQDNHNLIKKSLYIFQVRHWLQVLGHEKIRVVTTEEVARDQKSVLRDVLSFIGLCPFTFGNLGKVRT